MSNTLTIPAGTTEDTAPGSSEVTKVAAAPAPRGALPAVGPALLLALVLLGAAVVLVRDALVGFGVFTGDLWSTTALEWFDGREAAGWMVPAGIVVALIGLWMLLRAFRPRPRTALAVGDTGQVWIEPRDLARLARATAGRVDGVVEVRRVSATLRKVKVGVVTTTADPRTLRDEVREELRSSFAALDKAPTSKVRATTMGERS